MKETMFLLTILCMLSSAVMAGRLAYWRFEQGPAGAPVPKTVGGFVFEPSIPDSSGNGNELSAWDKSTGGYVFRSQVAFGTVASTGAANQFSVKNSGSTPGMFTDTRDPINSITPLAFTIEATFKLENGPHRTIVGRDSYGTVSGIPALAALYLVATPDNRLAIRFCDVKGYWHEANSAAGILTCFNYSTDPDGTSAPWYSTAAVSDGFTLSLYLFNHNNPQVGYQLIAQTDMTLSGSTNTALTAGAGDGSNWDAGNWTVGRGLFDGQQTDRAWGYIDEVSISDNALVPSQFLASSPSPWQMKQGVLMTPWSEVMNPNAVLPDYPRPQMVRTDWLNLNGIWQFQPGKAGDSIPTALTLSGKILVPFPVESPISGVMQHHERLWYRRQFDVPAGWSGKRILLHFGAVDWESEVYINGTSVGVHKGGYDAFSYDITSHVKASGPQELIVRVYDPTDSQAIALGKQRNNPTGEVWFVPNTGIWQTVWLEPVNPIYMESLKLVPDIDHQLLNVNIGITNPTGDLSVELTARNASGQIAGTAVGRSESNIALLIPQCVLWQPEDPYLYSLEIRLMQNGSVIDRIDSYFGMRKSELQTVDGITRMTLNNKFIFQMGPLDHGYWPDGVYTAPADEALKWDIELMKKLGFNMVRKHVKIEPARWYYWADKLGLMVWQDMPSMRHDLQYGEIDLPGRVQFEQELSQMVLEHYNSPSIVLWVVFNESWGQFDTQRVVSNVMQLDPSRLVTCASGWDDYDVGHIIDMHHYPEPAAPAPTAARAAVNGEYGGIGYVIPGHIWGPVPWQGYASAEQVCAVYERYVCSLMDFKENPGLSAAIYTEIIDTELELVGFATYDRKVIKVNEDRLAQANTQFNNSYTTLIPASEMAGQTWKYTTVQPAASWYTKGFNDLSWPQSQGGFGVAGGAHKFVRTAWNSSDIWLRREFTLGDLSAEQLERLVLKIHHDDDAEVYINGIPALTLHSYTTRYLRLPMLDLAKASLKTNQTNLIAIHCHHSGGGQYIDAGIDLRDKPDNCGQWGYYLQDLNRDCKVDIDDLVLLMSNWMSGVD